MMFRRTNAALLFFMLAISVFSPTLSAQYTGGVMDPELPLLSKRVLDKYERVLNLSPREAELFKVLLQAQQAEHARLLEELRALGKSGSEILLQLYPGRDFSNQPTGPDVPELKEKRIAIARQEIVFSDRIIEFKRRAIPDLRAILSLENQVKWDELLRDSRRRLTIGSQTQFIAEPLDLVYLLSELEVTSPALEALLKTYAEELDPPLQRRNKIAEESLREHMRKLYSGAYEGRDETLRRIQLLAQAKSDHERAAISTQLDREVRQRRVEEKRPAKRASLTVRDINRRYIDLIRANLTPQQNIDFTALYQKNAYPYYPIFIPLAADHFLTAILADDDLDEAQRTEITRIRDVDYIPHRDELNLALADAYERWELRWEDRILKTLDPSYEARIRRRHQRRRALQERIIKQIVQLLPAEALEKHAVPTTIKDEPRL